MSTVSDEDHVCETPAEEPEAPPLCSLGIDESPPPSFMQSSHSSMPSFFESFSANMPAQQSANDLSVDEGANTFFWSDLNSNIPSDEQESINLHENLETYTGYNGTELWADLYQACQTHKLGFHNNFGKTVSSEPELFESRLLCGLVSGLHLATNLHIARYYHPPSKRKGTVVWAPNLAYFRRQMDDHPERLQNLGMGFLLLLRSVHRAAPLLKSFDFGESDPTGDGKPADRINTRDSAMKGPGAAVHRLLEAAGREEHAGGFRGFDESAVFRGAPTPTIENSPEALFKGAFLNTSALLDCVSCQKCRLHAKVELRF